MERTSAVHRGDFLGLKTSMQWLMFCSVQSGSVCNSLILSGNTIYTGISLIWLSVSYYMHSASAYVTYWVSYSHLFLYLDDTLDIWVGRRALTFGSQQVYISILMLWFSNWEFYAHFDFTFWVWIYERSIRYGLFIRTYTLHMCIYMNGVSVKFLMS